MEFNAVIYTYLPASLQARDMNFVGVHLGGVGSFERVRVYMRACMGMRVCVCWMNKFLCFGLTAISSENNFIW